LVSLDLPAAICEQYGDGLEELRLEKNSLALNSKGSRCRTHSGVVPNGSRLVRRTGTDPGVVERGVRVAGGNELVVRAEFEKPATVDERNPVGPLCR
jgi:hypothetical protein